jgi:hypothetical protein
MKTPMNTEPEAGPTTTLPCLTAGDMKNYTLKYREPGKRPGTERWAKRKVTSVDDAVAWMNANQDKAFLPAFVLTNSWRPEIVAFIQS